MHDFCPILLLRVEEVTQGQRGSKRRIFMRNVSFQPKPLIASFFTLQLAIEGSFEIARKGCPHQHKFLC